MSHQMNPVNAVGSMNPMNFMSTTRNISVPIVITRDPNGERVSHDLYSRLLTDRKIFISEQIEPRMASIVVSELLYLQSEDASEPIEMYIMSPGGEVSSGLSIVDTMSIVTCPIHTFSMGIVASMASVIASAGTKGKRYVLPNVEIMIHQVSFGMQGTFCDNRITFEEGEKTNKRLMKMLADNCGKTEEEIEKLTQRDYWMDANEAVAFGIVDEIVPFAKK